MKYRLLKAGEIIRKGDQFAYHGVDQWFETKSVGVQIGLYANIIYRRPINPVSRTSTNSRLRKCPHCHQVIRRALPKAADVG